MKMQNHLKAEQTELNAIWMINMSVTAKNVTIYVFAYFFKLNFGFGMFSLPTIS